ncbi:hypothetical protein F5878DRAFT_667469 [Lentinula raphanica]|uniref:Uncharacterized protein n=1 Tax=Lentinula raphanica TaxID=153919 RepID=A0AA38NVW2_9AGAR|nr:hypothetical protein F5878DRAFT_667469 [Lentinula raphanica]
MDILAQAAEMRSKEGQVFQRDEEQGYPASLASQGPHRPSPMLLPPGLSQASHSFQINSDHSQPSINSYTPHNYFAPSTTSHYYNYPVNQHTPSSTLNIHLSSPSRSQTSHLNLHIHSPLRNSNLNATIDVPSNSFSFEDIRPPSPTPLSPSNYASTSQTFHPRPCSRSRSITWSISPVRRHKRRYSSSPSPTRRPAQPSPTKQPAQPFKEAGQASQRAGQASKRAKSSRNDAQDDGIVFTSVGPVVEGEGDSNKNWPAAKKSIVFEFILGVNAETGSSCSRKHRAKSLQKQNSDSIGSVKVGDENAAETLADFCLWVR